MYLTLHGHYQNDSSMKTGSDEIRFNISYIVESRPNSVHGPQLLRRKHSRSGESSPRPYAHHPKALPLGQTGSCMVSSAGWFG